MKKRIALLLVLVMTLALFTGCAAKDTTEPKTTTEPEAPEEPAEPVELIAHHVEQQREPRFHLLHEFHRIRLVKLKHGQPNANQTTVRAVHARIHKYK